MKKGFKTEIQKEFLEHLESKFGVPYTDLMQIISSGEKVYLIPVSVYGFGLSVLESTVKFLRENQGLSFAKIGSLMNRDQRAIGRTYNNAKKKLTGAFVVEDSLFYVPLHIFQNRDLGVLEAVVLYLHENLGLSFSQISALLSRDDRTIWTSYNRGSSKVIA